LHEFASQKLAQFLILMSGKELAQVFSEVAVFQVAAQQALDRVWNLAGRAAVANRTRRCLVQADGATQAEVVRIHHAAIQLDLFALNANVSDPVLTATVRTPCDMELQVLIETRQPLLQFLDQPAREALRFRDGQFAELGPAARNCSPPERGSTDAQPDCIYFSGKRLRISPGDVDDQQVL